MCGAPRGASDGPGSPLATEILCNALIHTQAILCGVLAFVPLLLASASTKLMLIVCQCLSFKHREVQ